jgi:hypothetical protein
MRGLRKCGSFYGDQHDILRTEPRRVVIGEDLGPKALAVALHNPALRAKRGKRLSAGKYTHRMFPQGERHPGEAANSTSSNYPDPHSMLDMMSGGSIVAKMGRSMKGRRLKVFQDGLVQQRLLPALWGDK